MVDYPAISGVDDASQVRMALVQNKEIVHAPLLGLPIQPLDPMLTALAALVTVADRGLYFTGADAPALFTLTAAGRALMDDADAAAMRTTLGVDAAKATFASVVTTSGTSIDFTGIPSTVTRITLNFNGVSTNGTSVLLVQLGDSGGIENTGYATVMATINSATPSTNASTAGFQLPVAAAAAVRYGTFTLNLIDAATFTWSCFGGIAENVAGTIFGISAGRKATSAALDRVRLTTVGGTDTFDLGSMNISWE